MATVVNFTSSKTIVNTRSLAWSFYGLTFIKWFLGLLLITPNSPLPKKKKAKQRKQVNITPEPRSILINFSDETWVMLIA